MAAVSHFRRACWRVAAFVLAAIVALGAAWAAAAEATKPAGGPVGPAAEPKAAAKADKAAPSAAPGSATPAIRNPAPQPKEPSAEEIAALVKETDARKTAAEAAVKSLGNKPSPEERERAASLLEQYCQAILEAAGAKAPTEEKRAHCRAAIELADALKAKSDQGALAPVASLNAVQQLAALLQSPREEVKARFARAAQLFRDQDYRQAADVLSSYLEVSETARECSGLLLRGLCRAYLSYTQEALSDWQKVRDFSKEDRLVRKAIYWTALHKLKLGQKDDGRDDLQLLVERYAPSEESGKAAALLKRMFPMGKRK